MEDEVKALTDFGLSTYEARVMRALLHTRGGSPQRISQAAGVPHSWIHSVLKSLTEKGLVDASDGRPRRYRAQPVSEVVNILEEAAARRMSRYRRLIYSMASEPKRVGKPIPALLVCGRRDVLRKLKEATRGRREVNGVVSGGEEYSAWLMKRFRRLVVGGRYPSVITSKDWVFVILEGGENSEPMGVVVHSRELALRVSQLVDVYVSRRRGTSTPRLKGRRRSFLG